MKHIKRCASLLLALVMALALSVSAFATQEGTLTGGSITIDNAVVGQTYNAYQILYLESYDATSGNYAYKANSAWATWLKTQTTYVSIDDQGYVTWVEGADAAAFAKAARAYAVLVDTETSKTAMTADATATATTTEVKFENLKLGYYLVDSSLGTLCSLDTTNPDVTIKEKNGVPENEKEVQEDSKVDANDPTKGWDSTNDADIGQTVNFQSTITAQAGAENYVFHDKMSVGLTYVSVTGITLQGEKDTTATTVATSNYTVKTGTDLTDGCTFEVVFTQAFCDTLKANDKIVISYTATVNENAVVGLDGNKNESWLDYGDETNTKSTPKSETITYTWDVDVLKYANGNESNVLEGVKFVLLNSDKSKVATVSNGKLTGWVDVPTAGTDGKITWPANTVLTTGEDGKISVDGLDADTYYLREIEALPGFNVLSGDEEFTIEGAKEDAENDNKLKYETLVVKINNQSGTELPSTGGIGTTIFYVVGAILVVGAGVLLVTRKRMSNEE